MKKENTNSAGGNAGKHVSEKRGAHKVAIDKRPTKPTGRHILEHFSAEMTTWVKWLCPDDNARDFHPDNYAELKTILKQLASGRRSSALASRMVKLVPFVLGHELLPLARVIRDLVSRPARPALLPIRTVQWLTHLSAEAIRGLVRDGELRPRRGSGNRLLFEASNIENVLRRHYVGPSVAATEKKGSLLLLRKYSATSEMDELSQYLMIDRTIVQRLVDHWCLPGVRVGKTCLVFDDDIDKYNAYTAMRGIPHMVRKMIRAQSADLWLLHCRSAIMDMEREAQQRAAADIEKGAETVTTAGGSKGLQEQQPA